MSTNFHWSVLGPGAISGLIAGHLLEAQQPCQILTRNAEHEAGQLTLMRETSSNTYSVPFVPTHRCHLGDNSIIIVAVKAFDVVSALQSLVATASFYSDTPIILSHNGMLELPDSLNSLNIYHLVTTHGAVKRYLSPTDVVIDHRGKGRSWLQQKANSSGFESLLTNCFSPVTLERDIQMRRWSKLLVNCVINPLTAIHQCKNGELLKTKWQALIQSLVEEAVTVAHSMQIALDKVIAYKEIIRVAEETQHNESSMLQDVRHNRRSEINYLTGYIVDRAKKAGIKTPAHDKLMADFTRLYPQ